jgi:hypothetical protein
VTVFCNRLAEDGNCYHCEADWKQGTEVLGKIQYRITPGLVTLE